MLTNDRLKIITLWIKGFVLLGVIFMLYYTINKNENWNASYFARIREVCTENLGWVVVVVLLLPVNIFIEAAKWKYLIAKIERISYWQAIEGVLAGISMGFVTPHSIGDYAARVLTLENKERIKAIGTVFLCRISQFYVTLYFGTAALVLYLIIRRTVPFELYFLALLAFLIGSNLLFAFFYIFHKEILRQLQKIALLTKLLSYFELIRAYSFKEINIVFLLSFLRYLVFSVQFMILLYLFGVSLPVWWLFIGVSFTYVVKSIIPTFFDIGIREAAAVLFFMFFGFEKEPILCASFTIWLCNIAFPALLGLGVVMKLKGMKKK